MHGAVRVHVGDVHGSHALREICRRWKEAAFGLDGFNGGVDRHSCDDTSASHM